MFLKFCCRNVRETNFLTIIFIVVLSFEACISRDKRSCGEVFVQRSQNKSGFHRSEKFKFKYRNSSVVMERVLRIMEIPKTFSSLALQD